MFYILSFSRLVQPVLWDLRVFGIRYIVLNSLTKVSAIVGKDLKHVQMVLALAVLLSIPLHKIEGLGLVKIMVGGCLHNQQKEILTTLGKPGTIFLIYLTSKWFFILKLLYS